MEVILTKKQAKQTKDMRALKREFGPAGEALADCLDLLRAADNLRELLDLPPSMNRRCHELKHNLKDTFSMDIKHPYRLLFRPEDPIPRRDDNGVDYVKVRIVAIKDLHSNTHE